MLGSQNNGIRVSAFSPIPIRSREKQMGTDFLDTLYIIRAGFKKFIIARHFSSIHKSIKTHGVAIRPFRESKYDRK